MYFIKRLFDIFFSLMAIIITGPLLVIISILIVLDSKGGVIFKQKRLGKDGKDFTIYKFRTMVENAENIGSGIFSYENDNRVTMVGKILRKTSLDELPQSFNILKGDLSFVGPRPPVTYYPCKYHEYNDFQKQRFQVKPGLTGLALIKGRKELAWGERIKYDVEYVHNMSLLLDIKILFLTIPKVLKMSNNYNVNSKSKQLNEKNKSQNHKMQNF